MTNIKDLKNISEDISILYVEDEDILRETLFSYLNKIFNFVDTASDGLEGLKLYKEKKYDLIITDIKMPQMSGLEMVEEIKAINRGQKVLIISAYSEIENFITSIKLGVDGYVLKPVDYTQLNEVLYKISFNIKQFKENEQYKNNLEKMVDEKTKQVKELLREKLKNYRDVVYALVKMVEDRDTYTGGHSQRVAKYSKMIAKHLGLDDKQCDNIYQAGVLHDIGKIAIPDSILLKPGNLNETEYNLIKEHVRFGVEVLSQIPMFKDIVPIIKSHHERYDGSGYPDGLKGEQIPFLSQIMGIADSFDAMTTSRIYKSKKNIPLAILELEKQKDKYFNGEILKSALEVLKDIKIEQNIDQLPKNELEEERFSYFFKDPLTHFYNKEYLDFILVKNKDTKEYKTIFYITMHNLKEINDKKGWEKGDEFLKEISFKLQSLSKGAMLFRVFVEDFICLYKDNINLTKEDLNFEYFDDMQIKYEIRKIDLTVVEINNIKDISDYLK